MPARKPQRLKLRAIDPDDYQVLAACLQDALMPLAQMAFRRKERRFVALVRRFVWERQAADGATGRPATPLYQFDSGLRFEGVERVRHTGIDRSDSKSVLELLTIVTEPAAVTLVCAGGAAIRLEGRSIVAMVEDRGRAEAAPMTPRHDREPGS